MQSNSGIVMQAEASNENEGADGAEAEAEETTTGEAAVEESGATDILNSPAFLKRKLEVLKSDIGQLEEEISNAKAALEQGKEVWGDKLAAIRTERGILQDRMSKQLEEAGGAATVEVVGNMISVLDNFDRAFQSVTPETDADREAEEAYKMAYSNILGTFRNLGVNEVETVGKEFDYEMHNAVMMRPSDEYEEGVVVEELQKGFVYGEIGKDEEGNKLNGQLIRAAMVIVSA